MAKIEIVTTWRL